MIKKDVGLQQVIFKTYHSIDFSDVNIKPEYGVQGALHEVHVGSPSHPPELPL